MDVYPVSSQRKIAGVVDFSNTTVTLSWVEGIGLGSNSVVFVFVPLGAIVDTKIGTDTNMADGASVTWVAPAGARAVVP